MELKTYGKIAVGAGAVGLTIYGVYLISKEVSKYRDRSNLDLEQKSTITAKKGKPLFNLLGKPIKDANLGLIAADLHDSLKFPTDDPRVVRVFQSTPFGYVPELEKYFLKRYNKNLKQELVENLSDKYWIKIKFNFR